MDDVLTAVAERWPVVDPLLPVPRLPADVPALAVAGAVAAPRRLSAAAGEPLPLPFAAHRFTLRPMVAGPDVAAGLDRLLTEWRRHIQAEPAAADDDSGAYIFLPSRDTEAAPALLRHGLVPYVVVAARAVAHPVPEVGTATVRQAGPGDVDVLSELALAQFRSEIELGPSVDRPDVAERLRAELVGKLAVADPWIWLAEVDGRVVGAVTADRPDLTAWLTQFTDRGPIADVRMARVEAADRGAGVGATMIAAAHRAFEQAGVGITLLHYSLLNPRSGPFWHRMGYRPLWTGWKACPAAVLR